MKKGQSTVFFSATLLPVLYYKELLSGNLEDYAVYVQSPFPQENRLLLIGGDVSSRYTRRNVKEYEKVADYIEKMVMGKQGNYMVFFPSYQYLKEVEEVWKGRVEEKGVCVSWISQGSRMVEEEKEQFLHLFEEEREESFVAFCVMGGIFSEGIDLKGEALIGAAVIGTGLPQVCNEREILKNFYEAQGMDGFAYAYRYPGMNKVLQAAGRVIRTPEDQGIVLLLDERFLNSEYKRLYPLEWEEYEMCTLSDTSRLLEEFWSVLGKEPDKSGGRRA